MTHHLELYPSPPADRCTHSTIIAKRREHQLLLQALRRLPIDLQVTLELYYWEDLSASEIAQALEIPEGTVRSRVRRAKELLEQRIAQLAADPAEIGTTLTNLDDWAKQLRTVVLPD